MITYGQFCPVAKGAEVFGDRWTPMVSRLMGTFQDGMATLDRIRRGGRQTVTVQHVNVGPGGQAVVAGNLKAGAGKSGQFPRSARARKGGQGPQKRSRGQAQK